VSGPRSDEIQIELLRQAGPERRVDLAFNMSAAVIGWARAAIDKSYPSLDRIGRDVKFIEVHHGPELAARVERALRARR
jgi:hypothetical protein